MRFSNNHVATHVLGQALSNSIRQNANHKFIKQNGNKLLFNGFWRDGDKQNICVWLDTATWHDAKTGQGGGCKEFAQIAFGITLSEFLSRFGLINKQDICASIDAPPNQENNKEYKCTNNIWDCLIKINKNIFDNASSWLSDKRGFFNPKMIIGSGFANLNYECLNCFDKKHIKFIKQRLAIGQQMIVPIRSVDSDKVVNLFFRTISEVTKTEKSRLLPNQGGWKNTDNSPRGFGFLHLIHDFPNLVICEGMADYFAAEYLLIGEEKYLPLGAPSASSLPKWAQWLKDSKYNGKVILVYQLDRNKEGKIKATGIGQQYATEALKILRTTEITSELFNWCHFLKSIPNLNKIPHDLADVYSIVRTNHDLLRNTFLFMHQEK